MATKRTHSENDEAAQMTTYWLHSEPKHVKSRRLDPSHGIPLRDLPFLQLLEGREPIEAVHLRWKIYHEFWNAKQKTIDAILTSSGTQILEDMKAFVEGSMAVGAATLSTAILLPGANISNHARLFGRIVASIQQNATSRVMRLSAKQCPTIRKALASVVLAFQELLGDSEAGSEGYDEDDDGELGEEAETVRTGPRLHYDLDVLVEWFEGVMAEAQSTWSTTNERLTVFIEDAEAFEVTVLCQLVLLLSLYREKLPLKLVLGVSSSLTIFLEKLPRTTLRLLDAAAFDAENSESVFNQICEQVVLARGAGSLTIGPLVAQSLAERQLKSSTSIDFLVRTLRYCYMAFFFSQPLSILISDRHLSKGLALLTPTHIQELRMLPSFQRHVEQIVRGADSNKRKTVLRLLSDDEAVLELLSSFHETFADRMDALTNGLTVIATVQAVLGKRVSARLELYRMALCPLRCAALVSDLADAVRDASRTKLKCLATRLIAVDNAAFSTLLPLALFEFLDSPDPLMDKTVLKHDALETIAVLRAYLAEATEPRLVDVLFHELFVFDRADLLETAFSPCVRPTLEDALVDSRKYLLGLSPQEKGHSDPFHAIAVLVDPLIGELFRLYREANTVINIHDFYLAFQGLFPRDKLMPLLLEAMESKEAERVFQPAELDSVYRFLLEGVDEEEKVVAQKWEKVTLSWFLQGISEMAMLGFLKDGNKRSESLEKLVWKGL